MPSTLEHIGIQSLLTRAVLREADIKWIWLGCLVPDLPWIGQRVARGLSGDTFAYDIRLYAIIQSSLFFCLVFALAMALFSRTPARVFAILAAGAIMHLVLDGLQTKWANGVILGAPFDWRVWNGGLFWPEDWPSWALAATGVGYAAYAWVRLPRSGADLVRPATGRGVLIALFFGAYLLGPFALERSALAQDPHFLATLRDVPARPDKPVAFDRARVGETIDGAKTLNAWTGENFALNGAAPDVAGTYSIQGRFESPATIHVIAAHAHLGHTRDYASYLGLLCVALWWAVALWHRIRAG